jgi:Rrf2 family protein
MKRGDPVFNALHLLVHLAAAADTPLTSEHLAECLRTNPVVVRRALADLRRSGLVQSARGHGGGWTLGRPAAEITVQAVYAALGAHLWTPPAAESPGCALEASVDRALTGVYQDIERLLADRLHQITLADLRQDVFSGQGRPCERGRSDER